MAFYNLAVALKNKGVPIDGVGLQCHFSVGEVDSVKLAKTVQRFAEAGLKCIITELDMGIPSTTSENLEEQARNYRVVTDIMLKNDNCPSMVIWGIKDNDSWRSASNPLLYNSGMQPKPAWRAVRSALRHHTLVNSIIPHTVQYKPLNTNVYTIDGRHANASSLKPGIYIKEGKKFIVRP